MVAPITLTVTGFILIPILVFSFLIDQYTHAKWIAYDLTVSLALIPFIFSGKQLELPEIKKINLLILSVIITYFFSLFLNPGNYENQLLDWIVFFLVLSLRLIFLKIKTTA